MYEYVCTYPRVRVCKNMCTDGCYPHPVLTQEPEAFIEDKQPLDLSRMVLNTEGHPLPILGAWQHDAKEAPFKLMLLQLN